MNRPKSMFLNAVFAGLVLLTGNASSAAAPARKSVVDVPMPPPPVLKPRALPRASGLMIRPIRVAMLDPQVQGDVPPRALAAFTASLAPEIRKLEGVSAISSAEVREMISLERQRQMLGCGDDAASCLAEIAGALDADELISIELNVVGASYSLTARRSDMRKAKVVHSQTRRFEKRDGEELLSILGPLVEGLYPDHPLKPGKRRGVDTEVARRLNPPPLPKWVFIATASAAAVTGVGGLAMGKLSADASARYNQLIEQSQTGPVFASSLSDHRRQAEAHAATANILYGTAGALVLGAIAEAFLTDWGDDRAALSAGVSLAPSGAGVAFGATF